MGDPTDDLADIWRWFAETQFRDYSPIYERIATVVADDRDTLELLRTAPPAAHLPMAPLAAARYLLLDGLDHPLGDVYHGRSDADPGPLFIDLCRQQRGPLLALLETRRVQTNDCGRSALIGPALTWAAPTTARPTLSRRCRRERRDQPALRSLPDGLRPRRRPARSTRRCTSPARWRAASHRSPTDCPRSSNESASAVAHRPDRPVRRPLAAGVAWPDTGRADGWRPRSPSPSRTHRH